jgi:hypothetical protein
LRKPLARSGPVKRPYRPRQRKRRYLLYCEGAETEPSYFRGLMRVLRTTLIDVEIGDEQKDPKGLVELAKAHRDRARRAAKRAGDDSLKYDEVWCVFDVDQHARLADAIQQAAACSIELAISNPCFELWLLIHFVDQWAYISCADAQSAVRGRIHGYAKKVEYSMLKGKAYQAVERAKEMDRRAIDTGETIVNPTTGVWRLLSTFCTHAGCAVEDL